MYGYIYKITNKLNGKIYVGKRKGTCIDQNYYGSGIHICLAIKKEGIKNFEREILQKCNSLNTLNKAEKYWIKKLKARNSEIGYNIAEGGDGGDKVSKLSIKEKQAMKNKKQSQWKNKTKEEINEIIQKRESHTDKESRNLKRKNTWKKKAKEIWNKQKEIITKIDFSKNNWFNNLKTFLNYSNGRTVRFIKEHLYFFKKLCITGEVPKMKALSCKYIKGKDIKVYLHIIHPKGYVKLIPIKHKTRKGAKWYTDGEHNKIIFPGQKIPKGYKKGRYIKPERKTSKNYICYTNGQNNIFLPKGKTPPKGFYKGQTTNRGKHYKDFWNSPKGRSIKKKAIRKYLKEKNQKRLDLFHSSNIDITKPGWREKLAKLFKGSLKVVDTFVAKNKKEFNNAFA